MEQLALAVNSQFVSLSVFAIVCGKDTQAVYFFCSNK